jgi:hypothetical protein
MLPEVENYLTVFRTTDAEWRKNRTDIQSREDFYENLVMYRAEISVLDKANSASHKENWNKLKESDNTLVAYIAENCSAYRDHAVDVLRLLPCSLDTLNAFAKEKNWCGVWGEFVEEAKENGLFEGIPHSPERKALTQYMRYRGISSTTRAGISELVNAIVAADTATVVTDRITEAPGEADAVAEPEA